MKGTKQTKVLFQEMDGLWINMQGTDRPRKRKSSKKELKLGAIYEGWKVRNVNDKKARRQLISLFNCGNVEEGLQEITELLIKNNTNKKEFEKLTTLYNYLVSNKIGLVPYKMRAELKGITPLEGMQYI